MSHHQEARLWSISREAAAVQSWGGRSPAALHLVQGMCSGHGSSSHESTFIGLYAEHRER